jgi:hypothetical protein
MILCVSRKTVAVTTTARSGDTMQAREAPNRSNVKTESSQHLAPPEAGDA